VDRCALSQTAFAQRHPGRDLKPEDSDAHKEWPGLVRDALTDPQLHRNARLFLLQVRERTALTEWASGRGRGLGGACL
jgi:hypothetical protein